MNPASARGDTTPSEQEDFVRLTERDRFVSTIEEGLADSEAGRVVSDKDVTARFDRRFSELADE